MSKITIVDDSFFEVGQRIDISRADPWWARLLHWLSRGRWRKPLVLDTLTATDVSQGPLPGEIITLGTYEGPGELMFGPGKGVAAEALGFTRKNEEGG
jgi:hypothetical protein